MLYLIQKYWCHITIILIIAITTLSLWPASHLPSVPGTDKTHHLIAYTALALPPALRHPKYALYFVLSFITFSGIIELVQPYVNRYGEWLDLLANTVGLMFGWLLAKIILFITQNNT